jgi:hypothetical protein
LSYNYFFYLITTKTFSPRVKWKIRDISDRRYISFYQNEEILRPTSQLVSSTSSDDSLLQVWGVNAVNHLEIFYDIHQRKGEMHFFCPGDHTRSTILRKKKRDFHSYILKFLESLLKGLLNAVLIIKPNNVLDSRRNLYHSLIQ